MTPTGIRAHLATLGWSPAEMARRVGVSKRTAHRWCDGHATVPSDVAAWLADLAAAMVAMPAPSVPDRRVRRDAADAPSA